MRAASPPRAGAGTFLAAGGRGWRRLRARLAGAARGPLGLGVLLLAGILILGTSSRDVPVPAGPVPEIDAGDARTLRKVNRLWEALARTVPRSRYVVIDRINNRISLREPTGPLVLEAPCSTGSGRILKDPEHGRQWQFATPQGAFRVISRSRDPVWRKPDWVFIEEGKPVPAAPEDRFEYGALGEYGLYFGDGYLIHGTLYERLLGRSVSHGCVRVGRESLQALYEACPVGTPIYVH